MPQKVTYRAVSSVYKKQYMQARLRSAGIRRRPLQPPFPCLSALINAQWIMVVRRAEIGRVGACLMDTVGLQWMLSLPSFCAEMSGLTIGSNLFFCVPRLFVVSSVHRSWTWQTDWGNARVSRVQSGHFYTTTGACKAHPNPSTNQS